MKHIEKNAEPPVLTDWKARANEDWQPDYADLRGDIKKAVKEALMDEQGYICCYCEQRLTDSDSHIEHFKPQSDPAVDPLDYGNLLCSCQNQVKKGEPRHCGILKEDWFDPDRLISPLSIDCESRFAYTGNGEIKPADTHDPSAEETIKKLGLDIPKLNDMRAKSIEPFLEDNLTVEDMRTFVSGYLSRDRSGQFGAFWTTIQYLFGNYREV
jgi:uncharacterized protein (TIGR02646 family)